MIRNRFLLVIFPFSIWGSSNLFNLPEIYQDVIIQGKVVEHGIRECSQRYEAIREVLKTLPQGYKSLDIGASQGYFSFKMAEEFKARCTMIEDSYTITNSIWRTGEYLQYLCQQNSTLPNLTLLQKKIYTQDLVYLKTLEEFDVVLAFAVIHHMRTDIDQYDVFLSTIDAILNLAPVVLIENPVNTGEHTLFIRKALQERRGRVIYKSYRDTLLYEIYLFDNRITYPQISLLPNIKNITYKTFNGTFTNVRDINV